MLIVKFAFSIDKASRFLERLAELGLTQEPEVRTEVSQTRILMVYVQGYSYFIPAVDIFIYSKVYQMLATAEANEGVCLSFGGFCDVNRSLIPTVSPIT